MEELTVKKADAVKYYRAANKDTQEVLRELFGADAFKANWCEITSYEKACEVLGIDPEPCNVNYANRPQYSFMGEAVVQLLTICEAINGEQGWYNEDGVGYFPVFVLYTQEEMDELGEQECKRRNIQLLAAANAAYSETAGVRCAFPIARGTTTDAHYGFPLCLNSEEKAEFVGKQFFELCCTCYGLTLKK